MSLLLNLAKEFGVSIEITKKGNIHVYDPKCVHEGTHFSWYPASGAFRKTAASLFHGLCINMNATNINTEAQAYELFKKRILKYRQ